jgi:hypothetical protein
VQEISVPRGARTGRGPETAVVPVVPVVPVVVAMRIEFLCRVVLMFR